MSKMSKTYGPSLTESSVNRKSHEQAFELYTSQ